MVMGGQNVREHFNKSLINSMLTSYLDIVEYIKYINKINFIFFFFTFSMWLLENLNFVPCITFLLDTAVLAHHLVCYKVLIAKNVIYIISFHVHHRFLRYHPYFIDEKTEV